MRAKQVSILAAALVLSQAAQLVAAHGDDHDMGMGKADTVASPQPPTEQSSNKKLISYFANGERTRSMVAHAALMVLAWVFVLPIGIMFSIAKHRFALLVQFLFLVINAMGLFFGIVFNTGTPDLYPNNAHHKMGWAATWLVGAQVLMGVLLAYSGRGGKRPTSYAAERAVFLPLSQSSIDGGHHSHESEDNYRWSGDSGQGTEPPSPSDEPNLTLEKPDPEDDTASDDEEYSSSRCLKNSRFDRFLRTRVPGLLSRQLVRVLSVAYTIIDRTILILGFACIATGGVTYAGIMRGDAVFNGLAHFIKGGIFFWYGVLTLGRWAGSFADFGWAWNVKPSRAEVGQWKARIPSGEFVESFVIFLYGASNVFLEHLAAWGGEWVAQDLEHVSISVMFFGGGLCGMLVESQKIRDLLNISITSMPTKSNPTDADLNLRLQPKVYKTPMNPLPALVILLLGLMMGSHHQTTMISSMIHKQWGTLFVGFSLARAVTYVLLYLRPPTSVYPSRPPSELIASFCLMGGGLIFMASNKDIVSRIAHADLNAMFVFTVGMGLTAFLMAWEVLVIAIKGWAVRCSTPRYTAVSYQQA